MKDLAKIFSSAIFAGLAIGIAGTVFLSVGAANSIIGSFLFGFGLLTIVVLGFRLFTGAIGYLAVQGGNTPRYAAECLAIWLGNLVGTGLVGLCIRQTRVFAPKIEPYVSNLVQAKLADGPLSVFVLAVFCGLLMYIAVDTYRKKELEAPVRLAVLFLCVVVFILCGFEHCIANMYYFAVSASFADAHTWAWLGLMTAGNAVGGMFLPATAKLR